MFLHLNNTIRSQSLSNLILCYSLGPRYPHNMRAGSYEPRVSDLPPRQRGRNGRRRMTDEEDTVMDSHEVSSVASYDQGNTNRPFSSVA